LHSRILYNFDIFQDISSVRLDIQGWYNSGLIMVDIIGPTSAIRIDSNTILESKL